MPQNRSSWSLLTICLLYLFVYIVVGAAAPVEFEHRTGKKRCYCLLPYCVTTFKNAFRKDSLSIYLFILEAVQLPFHRRYNRCSQKNSSWFLKPPLFSPCLCYPNMFFWPKNLPGLADQSWQCQRVGWQAAFFFMDNTAVTPQKETCLNEWPLVSYLFFFSMAVFLDIHRESFPIIPWCFFLKISY